MKIAVVGIGYVGLSNAVLLAQHNTVVALDVLPDKVRSVNAHRSPFADPEIEEFLKGQALDLKATLDPDEAFHDADIVIIATPTDYDPSTGHFDTSSVESVITLVQASRPEALVVIKSTVPVGFTESARRRFHSDNLVFSPEFLREGRALHDNLHPSRIVVGERSARAVRFAELMKEGAVRKDVPVVLTGSSEAEAIKLFANTYLAMRVAFFNELDGFAETRGLDAERLVAGVCLDPRIGDHYNNPSFGYGGYCLPKDSKQLLANFSGMPNRIMTAVVESNQIRADHIVERILLRNPSRVGIHRLAMKSDSDNHRQSAVLGVLERLQARGVEVIVYEPDFSGCEIQGAKRVQDLSEFKRMSDVIVANRMSDELRDVLDKVYTRDLYRRE